MNKSEVPKQTSFNNQPKIYTYKECLETSIFYFNNKNFVEARMWLEMASDILMGKEFPKRSN